MNATATPKPAVLAAPVNVEESRARRLQRQQARFRDRGGIFVPTNRSTLLDILLGKASPLKKPRRSASASPSRAKSTDNELSKPALRRSPRKQSQKTIDVVTEEQPPAMTDDPGSEVSKPIDKKATSSKSSKSRPRKTKAPPKRTKKPRGGTSVVDDSVVDTPTEKASKRSVETSEKKSLKVSTKKIIPDADDDTEDDVPLVKSKSKSKAVSKTKPKAEVDGAKETSKTRGCRPITATTAAADTSSTRLRPTRKVKLIYSELSEDDAACMPTKKAKAKKSAPPPDISKEDEEKRPPSRQGVKASLLKDKLGVARPAKSLNASDDDGDDDIKSKLKSKVTSSQGEPQDDSAYKPTKKSSTKKVLEDDVACKPAKKSMKKVKEYAAPMEKEKCQSLEEHNLAKDTPSESTSKAVVASSKGKKRTSASIAQDSDSQPRRKRIKSGTIGVDPSLHEDSNLSGEAPLVTSKKRRNPKDAESEVEDGVGKGTKRKKHSSPSESPEVTIEEDSGVKPVARRSRKVAKSTRKGKKQSSDNSTTTLKRKENAPMSKPSKKVASNSGPPKSVLQRIKDSLGAQVVDNEPDPIDFLS